MGHTWSSMVDLVLQAFLSLQKNCEGSMTSGWKKISESYKRATFLNFPYVTLHIQEYRICFSNHIS